MYPSNSLIISYQYYHFIKDLVSRRNRKKDHGVVKGRKGGEKEEEEENEVKEDKASYVAIPVACGRIGGQVPFLRSLAHLGMSSEN